MYEFGGQRYNSTLVSKVENAHIQSSNVDRRINRALAKSLEIVLLMDVCRLMG